MSLLAKIPENIINVNLFVKFSFRIMLYVKQSDLHLNTSFLCVLFMKSVITNLLFSLFFLINVGSLFVCIYLLIVLCLFCCRKGSKLVYLMMPSPGFQFSRFQIIRLLISVLFLILFGEFWCCIKKLWLWSSE